MKHLILMAIMVSMILAGCNISDPAQTGSVPTAPAAEWEPVTEPYEQPNDWGLAFGDEVWAVGSDGSDAYLIRYAFISQKGSMVEVVPYFTSDTQKLRESMGYTDLIEADRMYTGQYDAMVAVAEANGETFEEYWGETP